MTREAEAWRGWIATLRGRAGLGAGRGAGLGAGLGAGRLDAIVEPDSLAGLWRGAVREITWRLLLNATRERLLDGSRRRDCLSVHLADGPIAVPLARFGAFELDWPALDECEDPRLEDPLAVVELIAMCERLGADEEARVRAEIVDSIVNLAQARLAREIRLTLADGASNNPDDHSGDPRFYDPEHFVTDGHPWHPMNRTRLGLRRAEVVRYAAEQLATTPVTCVDVEASLVRLAGDYEQESRQVFGQDYRRAPRGVVRLPIHPAQRRRVRELFAPLWAEGMIRAVDEPAIVCRSLLSLRTVVLAPERHLKLACDVHTTSTRRLVSPASVHNGPEVSRLVLAIQARDAITAPLRLMVEPAAAGLEPDRVGRHAGELGAILRAAPSPRQANERAWVCAAVGERWPGTEELVLERAALGYPGGRRERIAALIDDWIRLLVPPALRLFARYGVALELHLQNTLVAVANGRAAGFWARDLGGIRIHAPRLAAASLAWAPSFAAGSFTVTEDLDEVRSKLEHTLVHAHLAHVFAVAGTLGVDEDASWAKLRRCIEGCLRGWAAEPGVGVELRDRLIDDLRSLTRPQVRAKALLRMRLHERSSDYDYTEVANALGETSDS